MQEKDKVAEAWKSYHRKESESVRAEAPSGPLRVYQRTVINRCSRSIEQALRDKERVSLWSAGSGIDIISLSLKRAFKKKLSVTVFDISPECVARNEEMFSRDGANAEFVVGDLFEAAYEDKFDIVMNTGLLEHFGKQGKEKLLKVFSKALVKDGVYITVTPYSGAKLYGYCKDRAIAKGSWPYGPENAVATLSDLGLEALALRLEKQVGATDQLVMLKHAFPRFKGALGYGAEIAERFSPAFDPLLRPFIGGYAILDEFVKT